MYRILIMALLLASGSDVFAQAPGGPASVGVVRVEKKAITQTNEFTGRIQAINRVEVVARVTAFLDHMDYLEGSEVKKGAVLYRLERGPFEADRDAKKAVAAQMEAQLQNAQVALERAQTLLKTQAGAQATVDSALATQRSFEAQLLAANANIKTSQINLDYTVINSPIDGRIGRTAVTQGNVVSPSSGVLATVVGQDPMYVVFPVSVRTLLDLRAKYQDKGGYDAVVVRIRLPDGNLYDQVGKLTFIDNTVQTSTDTQILRATIANPGVPISGGRVGRPLTDGEFVTVLLEGVQPIEVLAIPRAAVLTDQRSDFVYVVDADNKAQRRDIKLGQSTPTVASVIGGLKEGELVVADGLQRVRPGAPLLPSPLAPGPMESRAPGK
jgi:membrane fusion protein (multidrug efflux system)